MEKVGYFTDKMIKYYGLCNMIKPVNLLYFFPEGDKTAGILTNGRGSKYILVQLSDDFLPTRSLATQFLGGKWTAVSIVVECSVQNKLFTYFQALTDPNGSRLSNINDLNSLSWFARKAVNAHDRNRESRNTRSASYAKPQHRRVMIPA
jgi:hypothetical protein